MKRTAKPSPVDSPYPEDQYTETELDAKYKRIEERHKEALRLIKKKEKK